jgi:hypothetical protein
VAIPAWLRFVLAFPFLALTAVAAVDGRPLAALLGAAPVVLLLAAWVRYHDVPRAQRAFNARDRGRAWRLLESVPFGGRLLRRECRIYYHHARSLYLLDEERWQDAAKEAEAALGVPGIGDQAPGCHLAAAKAYAFSGNREKASFHAEAARKLPHTEAVERGLARLDRVIGDTA